MTDWIEVARTWARNDCDVETAAQALALAQRGDVRELEAHFKGSLVFGTAGLRAEVGPGPLRMNRAVVRQVTHAVAGFLKAGLAELRADREAPAKPRVVVGFDARLTSEALAREVVGVLAAADVEVSYLTTPSATPIVAYAQRALAADAAIVITASHNPPEYNGYKLYAANGAQIIPPADAEVAARLASAPPPKAIPCAEHAFDGAHPLAQPLPQAVLESYYDRVGRLASSAQLARDVRVVYTPLHGVGLQPVMRVLGDAGYRCLDVVAEQAQPDGNFPTVRFPNPEEPGALDRALALAKERRADLVIVNDPDADRLAVCVRDDTRALRVLTGNQIGVLLADYCLRRYRGTRRPFVVQSIVSSPMLESVAAHYAAHCERTLTGFKWIWNAALALQEARDLEFVFGYEEALGYCAEDIVRDKDGITAALLFCELASEMAAQGASVAQRLDELYRAHGSWVSLQHSVSYQGAEAAPRMREAVSRLAAHPPARLANEAVTEVIDYRVGGEARPPWLPNSPLVELRLGHAGRVLVRPSGTEPKLKVYIDLCERLGRGASLAEAQGAALERAARMAQQLLEVSESRRAGVR